MDRSDCYDRSVMSSEAHVKLVALSLVVLAACSSTAPVDGGGTRGAFAGTTTVIVVDEHGAPLAGATILGGEGDAARVLGHTDANGTLEVADAIDVVTATALGRHAVSVAGADAAVVTLALAPRYVATRVVNVSLPGWADVPLAGADYLRARAGVLLDMTLAAPAQPGDAMTECTRTEAGDACALRLAMPASSARIAVAIVRGTDPGTPDDESDDTLEPVGLALSDAFVPVEGMDVPVSMLDRGALVQVDVSTEGVPSDLSAVVGVPGASTEDGVIVWPFSGAGLVPAIAADASTHWAIGDAQGAEARSRTIARGRRFGDGDAITLDAWREPPSALAFEGGVMTTGGARAGELWEVSVADASGDVAWSGYLLDARSSIEPPSMVSLPSTGTLRATATVYESQAEELSFAGVEASWTERASRTMAF